MSKEITRQAELFQHLAAVEESIVKECVAVGRPRTAVNLVAVSKYMPESDIQILYDAGHRDFGENYVQELVRKAGTLPGDIRWHFIGALQSNKCKVLAKIPNLSAVETVDSASKAQKLNDNRTDNDSILGIFLQINTSGEDQKSGLAWDATEEVLEVARAVTKFPRLQLRGLMTIGSFSESHAEGVNSDFDRLSKLATTLQTELGVPIGLSMGMSSDFLEAIRQGSTNVRVGRTIFGNRPVKT